jgi:hypothetical protein
MSCTFRSSDASLLRERSVPAAGRGRYLVLALVTIVAGLAAHLHGGFMGALLRDAVADALWAAMIFWLFSLAAPSSSAIVRGASSLAFCVAIELSQLVRADWLLAIRRTTLGHLALGSDFVARDLVWYAGGVIVAATIEAMMTRRAAVSTWRIHRGSE